MMPTRHTTAVLELRARASLEHSVSLSLQLSCVLACSPAGRRVLIAIAGDAALRDRAAQMIARATSTGRDVTPQHLANIVRALRALASES